MLTSKSITGGLAIHKQQVIAATYHGGCGANVNVTKLASLYTELIQKKKKNGCFSL